MTLAIAAAVIVGWVVFRNRPSRLGNDILKFEIFKSLRFRNAREAAQSMRYEDLEKALWRKISITTVCVYASFSLSLRAMGLSWTYSAMISAAPTIMWLLVWQRFSKTYRQITLPLFATLCRMPQSSWDMRAKPADWVKVRLNKGRIWIRLPKDWHADKRSLETIRQIVGSRLSGQWLMEANTRKFLLTFKLEKQAETVSVTGTQEPVIMDTLDFTAEEQDEMEPSDGPW